MTDRQELHIMLDSVPDEDLDDARQVLKEFLEARERRSPGQKMTAEEHLQWLRSLPEEDYEMTDEEKASLALGREDIRAGRVHTFEDVAKELEM